MIMPGQVGGTSEMVHWRETGTGYVVSVSRRGMAAIWGLLGLVPAYLLYRVGTAMGTRGIEVIPYTPWVLALIGLGIYLGCLAKAATYWKPVAWVEVALKGKRARWGSREGTPMLEFREVERFESMDLLGPWAHHVVAALPGGRVVAVLSPWVAPPMKTRRVANRLNELLGADPTPRDE